MIACYKIDDYFEFPLSTRNCITGVGVDADALPTFRVYEENNETAVATGNTAKRDDSNTTGCYIARAQCTAAAGFEVGKKYSVWASATVNAVSDTAPIGEFMIVPVNVWNSLYGGTDSLEVDATAISGDTTAADNAELMFDGTGYAGGTTKLQTAVASIATDAITAASIKADAVTKIQAGLAVDSTVAKAATALSNLTWTDAKAGYLTGPVALEATLTAIKGAGWTTETLAAIDALIDAIKAKTDTIPANPAQVGSAMTLTSAYDNAKLAWSTLTAQQVWEYGTRTLSSFGTLVADTAAAVWNSLTSALTTVGSIGKLLSQFVFTEAGKVDASATATVDESAIAAAVIAGLGGATVTITSPVSQSNDVTILRDTDYTTEIAWTYTYSGSLTGYTAALHCAGAGITSHTVTIAGSAGAYTLTAAFTNTETAALDTCIDDYSITFTKTADNTVLPYGVEGVMVVRDWAGT